MALRKRAVRAYERGAGSYAQLAALFEVDHRTLERWVPRWRTARSVEPWPRAGGWRSPIDLKVRRVLAALLHEDPLRVAAWPALLGIRRGRGPRGRAAGARQPASG